MPKCNLLLQSKFFLQVKQKTFRNSCKKQQTIAIIVSRYTVSRRIWKATALPAGTVSGIPVETHMHAAGTVRRKRRHRNTPPAGKAVWYVTVRVRTELLMAMKARPLDRRRSCCRRHPANRRAARRLRHYASRPYRARQASGSVQLQPESLERSISGTLVAVAPGAPESVSWNSYPENTLGGAIRVGQHERVR